ncbi:hypothetical protein PHMEG_0006226 [Phytophthora megakarya]|uniref:Uncharacterized protein n=1 Tax=Phytophthora megakarya TaxID=4795 RepID=A0A225WPP2_9STRA|nr:hypothetical protein PHMEG_0006226 [Phytophthora megakarya]
MRAHTCRDCGSRKSNAREVVPSTEESGVGSPGDRWVVNVAGSLPVTNEGNRYVTATLVHTAKDVARFVMDKLVLAYDPMRE